MFLGAINRIPEHRAEEVPYLECMLVSAAPISDETALKAHKVFGDAMYQGYGQTEILPIAMMAPCGSPRTCRDRSNCAPAACRCPSLGCRSGTRTTNPWPDETGEIVAKCEGQMRGFWSNSEAMAERIVDGESGFQRDGTARSSISLETRERTSLISQGPFRPVVPAGRSGLWGENR